MIGKIEALRQVPIFRGLPAALLEEILGLCAERTYLKGEAVFHEGQPSKGLFVVWRGSLKIYKLRESGREQILEIEGPGRSVAELPLLDGQPYPASCSALEDSILLIISCSTFQQLLAREPALVRSVIASLAQRLRHMVGLVEEISLKAVRERLASLLLELAGERDTFELSWSNQLIAARIGTVREIVSRTLSRMVQEGVLAMDGRTITILDRGRL
jgi:CRP/FNR family transcriptional regulator